MDEFGYVDPLIWNERTGNIVGGHQRLKILKELGYTEVDCVVVDLDETREKALNIALNKIQGDWDEDKLELCLKELEGLGFSHDLVGFEPDEVDKIYNRNEKVQGKVEEDNFDADAEVTVYDYDNDTVIRNGETQPAKKKDRFSLKQKDFYPEEH